MYRTVCLVTLTIVWLMGVLATAQPSDGRFQYVSPMPAAEQVAPEAILIIRFGTFPPTAITNLHSLFSVRGSKSGPIIGSASLASDKKTVRFVPTRPFAPGEDVSIRIHAKLDQPDVSIDHAYSFRIAETPVAVSGVPLMIEPDLSKSTRHAVRMDDGDPVILNGISIPSDFPYMQVLESNDPAPGHVFLNNWGGQPYNMILDNEGNPVWYWRTPDRRRDFKVQPNGWLTMLVRGGYGGGYGHIALDSTFSVVDTIRAAAGYVTDEHELTISPDGNYFLIGRRETQVDMRPYVLGGQPSATVRETAIQEFTPAGELVFVWRSWDHFDIRDLQLDNLRGGYIRFPHMNALSIDDDGHILVSSRNLSEVTKINRQTGEIIWRLGGAHNQFTWMNDPFNGFTSQHDIRALGANRYTVFDNGNLHVPSETRVVEYEIDPANMTATLVWQYRHQPRRYTGWMGNAQRLPNGNTQINYADASLPKVVEVRPDGSKALEMDFVKSANSYRAFKFDWMGVAKRPYLVVENSSTRVTLLFNKFGDPDVDRYNIYGGSQPLPDDLIASTEQPFIHLTDLPVQARYYFRVTAVNAGGQESDYSNEESTFVNLTQRGENLVLGGDFSDRSFFWDFEVTGNAEASIATRPAEELQIFITEGGTDLWNIQVRQGNLPLINGREYRFEFDAYAEGPRIFEAKVTKDGEPWTNYGKIGLTALTEQRKHFAYDFVMDDPTDFASRIVLNSGTSDLDVFVDNVSLKELVPTSTSVRGEPEAQTFKLHPNSPNPFSRATNISYDLIVGGFVTLTVFNMLGQHVSTLINEHQAPGAHAARLHAARLPAGHYYYRLDVASPLGMRSASRQMVSIR